MDERQQETKNFGEKKNFEPKKFEQTFQREEFSYHFLIGTFTYNWIIGEMGKNVLFDAEKNWFHQNKALIKNNI